MAAEKDTSNWRPIVLAIIAGTPAAILALAAFIQAMKASDQTIETHKLVNSRMTELLELTRTNAAAKATLEEKDAEATRRGDTILKGIKK